MQISKVHTVYPILLGRDRNKKEIWGWQHSREYILGDNDAESMEDALVNRDPFQKRSSL